MFYVAPFERTFQTARTSLVHWLTGNILIPFRHSISFRLRLITFLSFSRFFFCCLKKTELFSTRVHEWILSLDEKRWVYFTEFGYNINTLWASVSVEIDCSEWKDVRLKLLPMFDFTTFDRMTSTEALLQVGNACFFEGY